MPRRWMGATTLLAALLAAASADAVEITDEHFAADGGTYTMRLTLRLEARRQAVWAALTDYGGLAQLAPGIERSRLLQRDGHQAEVKTVTKGCILFFCRRITRVEHLEEEPYERITATIDPARSDLAAGTTRWRLEPLEGGTQVTVVTEMEPDFQLPPLLGARLIRRGLKRDMVELLEAIEGG